MKETNVTPHVTNAQHAAFITDEEFASAMADRVWLVSHGGCASENLFEKLGLDYPAVDIRGRPLRGVVSHLPRPLAGPAKCIFLYGSPIEAILSQLRRGHYDNARKLQNNSLYRNMHYISDVLSSYDADPFGINSQFLSFCQHFVDYPIVLIRHTALGIHFPFLVRYAGTERAESWLEAPRHSASQSDRGMHGDLLSLYGGTADIMEQMPSIVLRLPVWRTGLTYSLQKADLIEFEDMLHLVPHARVYIESYSLTSPSDRQVRIKHAVEYKDSNGHQISWLNVRHDIVDEGFGSIGAVIRVNGETGEIFKISHPDISEGNVFSGSEDPRYFRRRGHLCVIFNALCHDGTRRMFLYFDEIGRCVKLQAPGLPLRAIEKNWTPFVVSDLIYFVYTLNPTVVLRLDDEKSGRCHVVNTDIQFNQVIEPIYPFGGTALLLWTWPYFIGLAHTRSPYRSVFYVFDVQQMSVVAVGEPFDLPEPVQAIQTRGRDVQYPYHLEVDGGRCFVWVECQDHCPTVYEFDFHALCGVISSLIATRVRCVQSP